MLKRFLLLFLIAIPVLAQDQPPPQPKQEKKPVHMGIGRTLTFPFRHPIKAQKAVATATKKTAKAIW